MRSGTTHWFVAVDFLIFYILIFVLFSFVRVADILIVLFFCFFFFVGLCFKQVEIGHSAQSLFPG